MTTIARKIARTLAGRPAIASPARLYPPHAVRVPPVVLPSAGDYAAREARCAACAAVLAGHEESLAGLVAAGY